MSETGDDWDDASTRLAEHTDLHRISVTSATLEVSSGPGAGRLLAIDAGGSVLGSAGDCDMQLSDNLVSRRHVQLRADPDGIRVTDLGSRNGTFVADMRIRDVTLATDARLLIGGTSLALRFATGSVDLPLSPRRQFGRAIGHSPAIRHVFAMLEQAAARDVTVLLEGDSGTGKDVLALSLHDQSARARGPFVVVDCGSIPENLVESELFGHERGAFTGAVEAKPGAFELADGGTLFLDEIGEMPLALQPKLLRALETRSFRRVGGRKTTSVDVRVVAATNRGLADAARRGEFRQDLYYRVAVLRVLVPRLADRPEDVEPLANMFLEAINPGQTLPRELLHLLTSYSWPGNARELRNVIERFATFAKVDPGLLFIDGPAPASRGAPWESPGLLQLPYHEAKRVVLHEFHRTFLPRAVEDAGSVAAAAQQLCLPRSSLHRMLKGLSADSGWPGK